MELGDAKHIADIDEIHVRDAVRPGDGVHTDAVFQPDAVQILARDDGVIPATIYIVVAIELARAGPAGRQLVRFIGNLERLPGVDEVGIENPVLGGDGVGVYSVGPRDAVQRLPRSHRVGAEDVPSRDGSRRRRRWGVGVCVGVGLLDVGVFVGVGVAPTTMFPF